MGKWKKIRRRRDNSTTSANLLESRILPDPEETAALGEHNNVEVEQYMAGLQRQITAYIRSLRSNRARWGSLQRSIVHEFQVAINGGTLLVSMLQQALLYARGTAPPNHPSPTVPYPPLSSAEAMRGSQMVVDEITCHCDIIARIMQEYNGETMAHEARVRAQIQRMEHSPIRRVRARRQRERSSCSRQRPGEEQRGRPSRETTEEDHAIRQSRREEEASVFPHLNPGGILTDTLSSMEVENHLENHEDELPPDAERGRGSREEENDQVDLMQRTGKRKRGSPEPALRRPGSTASFAWRTLQPPTIVPRARARGKRGRGRGRGGPSSTTITTREEVAENTGAEEDMGEEEVLADDKEICYREQ